MYIPSSLASIFKSLFKFFRLIFSRFVFFSSAKWPVIPSTSDVAMDAITDNTSGAISIFPKLD